MRTKELLKNLKLKIYQLVGNKRYMSSIDTLFKKMEDLELTNGEKEAIRYLAQDIQSSVNQKSKNSAFKRW